MKITRSPEGSLFEDPLSYLPRSSTKDFRRGQLIYDVDQPASSLCLVIKGCVKVSRIVGDAEIIMSLCQTDDFFGESAFVHGEGERAVAIEASKIMNWSVETVVELILQRPALGIGFIQFLTCHCFDLSRRIAAMSADSTARRLAKALLDIAERLGQQQSEVRDAMRLPPFPHKLLAQYVGTTREAVTHCMNRFRRENLVAYNRREMTVYCEPLREWLGTGYTPTPTVCLPLFVVERPLGDTISA